MSWGSGKKNKWGLKPTRERGQVVWTDNSGAKPAPFAQAFPKYDETRPIPPAYEEFLVIGSMWINKVPLNPDLRELGKCPFPGLVPMFWAPEQAVIKLKSLLIYSGIVRVDERERNGRIVSVPRHTFVCGDGRYIVTDFSHITPVT